MIRTSMPLAPATLGPRRRSSALREALSKTWLGLRDGVRAARNYQRLKTMSDRELARRGVSREEILRVAMFGKTGSGR
jgi:uncharacterized protein YjiS (DUF1127 family)